MTTTPPCSLDRIFIEITNVCNLSCPFCKPSGRAKTFMDRALFEKIIAQAKHLAREVVFHVLGEPLLHPDLEHFIDTVHTAGMSAMITTNGTLLGEAVGEMLAQKNIRRINISMHAAPDGPSHDAYCRTVFAFIDRVKAWQGTTLIHLRLWNAFSGDLPKTLGAINAHFRTQIEPPDAVRDSGLRHRWSLGPCISLHIEPPFIWPSPDGPILSKKGFCYGLRSHAGILSDGTVVPCCLDAEGTLALGSIHGESLAAILAKERSATIRQGFSDGRLTEDLCRRCGFIGRFKKKDRKLP
jgi:hypothetical protein